MTSKQLHRQFVSIAALLLCATGASGTESIFEAAQSDTCKDGNHHLGLVQLHAQSLVHALEKEEEKEDESFSGSVLSTGTGATSTTVIVTPAPPIPGSKPGPLSSCTKQMGCLQWEFTDGPTPGICPDGACEWTVCVTLLLSADGCVKFIKDTISHVCQKDDATCTPAEGFSDAKEITSGPIVSDGGKQCQTGTPGETLEFLFKDGRGCLDSAAVPDPSLPFDDVAITCAPRPATIASCTGNGVGKECIWTITLPASKDCTLWGDPHVHSFDHMSFSDTRKGDMWLVKSKSVFIQGRFGVAKNSTRSFLMAVAIGGPFLEGNTLTFGTLDESAKWNKQHILKKLSAEFQTSLNGNKQVRASFRKSIPNVNDTRHNTDGVDVELPEGIKLVVHRFSTWLGLRIKQEHPLEGGQDGVCGNFNSITADDSLQALSLRMDASVHQSESLFKMNYAKWSVKHASFLDTSM
mmetsp:Transcript_47949/g.88240  ORF Transcript_47949/g.88240 Transcript_47949/m.88240 type:complete len:465 (+) Transcript_47949:87-1481(+)